MASLGPRGITDETPVVGYPVVILLLTVSAPLADLVVGPRYEGGTKVDLVGVDPAANAAF